MNATDIHHESLSSYCPTSCERPNIPFLEVTSAIDEPELEVKTVDAQSFNASPVLALASDGSWIPLLPVQG